MGTHQEPHNPRGRTTPDWNTENPAKRPVGSIPPGWHYRNAETRQEAAQAPESPGPIPTEGQDGSGDSRASKTPRRKVLAGGLGGGVGGNIAVILAFHLPAVPDTVIVAYTSLLVTALAFMCAYMVREG